MNNLLISMLPSVVKIEIQRHFRHKSVTTTEQYWRKRLGGTNDAIKKGSLIYDLLLANRPTNQHIFYYWKNKCPDNVIAFSSRVTLIYLKNELSLLCPVIIIIR